MKRVHPSISEDEITYKLDNLGFTVDKVTQMRCDETNMHLVILQLPKREEKFFFRNNQVCEFNYKN